MSVLQAFKDICPGKSFSNHKNIQMKLYMHRCDFDLSSVTPYDKKYYYNITKVLQHMWFFHFRSETESVPITLSLYPHMVPLIYQCVYDIPNVQLKWIECDSWSGSGNELQALMIAMDKK